MSGQRAERKQIQKNTPNAGSGAAVAGPPTALRFAIEDGAPRIAASTGFPSALRPLCDPVLILAGPREEGPEQEATLLRGFRVNGRPVILAARARIEGDERRATALALPGALAEDRGPALVAALPDLLDLAEKTLSSEDLAAAIERLKPESRPKSRSSAEAAAARLLARLGEADARPLRAPVEASDEGAFWRAVAAFVGLTPPALRPAVSAFYARSGAAEPAGDVLLFADTAPAAVSAAAQQDAAKHFNACREAPLAPPRYSPEDSPSLETGLEALLVARLSVALSAAGRSAALKRYALDPAAPPPSEGDPAEMVLAAETAIEALRAGAVDEEALQPFGAARCVGWLAGRSDAARLWPALLARGPERAEWRALSLAEPVDAAPIASLGALARLAWAETEARAAAPDGVETPFDAPVFKARFAAAVAAGPDLLAEDPLALLDPAAPVDRLGAALEGQDPRVLSRPIDALELCAQLPPRETGRAALDRLGALAGRLRDRSGLGALARYGRPPVDASHSQAALFFGASWAHCLSVGAWSGAAFWRDRCLAWLEDRRPEEADAIEDALAGLRRFAAAAGEAGAMMLAEPALASAAAREPAPPKPRKPDAEAAPPEPRVHLSPNALQEAMAALRQGAEDDDGAPAVGAEAAAPLPRKRGAAPVDAGALADAARIVTGFREDFAAEAARRAAGGAPQALGLAFGDKKSFTAAIDAAATLALDDAAAAAEAYGAPIAWSLRQLAGLGRKPAGRPGFESAPDSVRGVWAALDAELEQPSAAAEFLGFLSKLLQADKARVLGPNLATDGFLSALSGASVTRLIGAESISFAKSTLRDYLYQGRRGEPKGGFEALDDEGAAARLDRALLFFALLDVSEEVGEPDPLALIEPLAIAADGAELRNLTPSDAALARLGGYLAQGAAPSQAHGAGFAALMQRRGLMRNTALAQLWRRVPRVV